MTLIHEQVQGGKDMAIHFAFTFCFHNEACIHPAACKIYGANRGGSLDHLALDQP